MKGGLRAHLLPLPTYIHPLGPIGKPWCRLQQDIIPMHPWGDDRQAPQTAGDELSRRFEEGARALLE